MPLCQFSCIKGVQFIFISTNAFMTLLFTSMICIVILKCFGVLKLGKKPYIQYSWPVTCPSDAFVIIIWEHNSFSDSTFVISGGKSRYTQTTAVHTAVQIIWYKWATGRESGGDDGHRAAEVCFLFFRCRCTWLFFLLCCSQLEGVNRHGICRSQIINTQLHGCKSVVTCC